MDENEYNTELEANKVQLQILVQGGALARLERDRGNYQGARSIGVDIVDLVHTLDEVTVRRLLIMAVIY